MQTLVSNPNVSDSISWNTVPLILTVPQAARLLQVTPGTVKKMCATGQLKAVKLGAGWRIDRQQLEDLMKHNNIE